jgi:hypothetical protein
MIKFVLLRYVPTPVLHKRDEPDRRSWVARQDSPNNEFWVGTASLCDTAAECVEKNKETIQRGISQYEFEIKQKQAELEEMKKLLA